MIKKTLFQLVIAVLFFSAAFCQDSPLGLQDTAVAVKDSSALKDTASGVKATPVSKDTTVIYQNQVFTLADVIVRNNLNVAAFIEYVKNDTTFYKAFRNLRLLSYSSLNDILLNDKKGNAQASLHSTTTQTYSNGCRTMKTNEEQTTGDFYDKKGN